jgi:hypothetical protein
MGQPWPSESELRLPRTQGSLSVTGSGSLSSSAAGFARPSRGMSALRGRPLRGVCTLPLWPQPLDRRFSGHRRNFYAPLPSCSIANLKLCFLHP